MKFLATDFPNGFDAEILRTALVTAHGSAFNLSTNVESVELSDFLIEQAGKSLLAVTITCTTHFATDWNAVRAAKSASYSSIDNVIAGDATLAQLKTMTNAEFDTWWAANVTSAPQAIQVLKRLAKVIIRRVL